MTYAFDPFLVWFTCLHVVDLGSSVVVNLVPVVDAVVISGCGWGGSPGVDGRSSKRSVAAILVSSTGPSACPMLNIFG